MTNHEKLFTIFQQMSAQVNENGGKMQMPPPMLTALPIEFLDFELGKSLVGRMRFDHQFTNPVFSFQGGFLAAAIDNILGPLTYMAAQKPVVTVEMSTSYLRPFVEKDEYIDIFGEVVNKTQHLLVLKADVKNKEGKLVAISTQHAFILNSGQKNQ